MQPPGNALTGGIWIGITGTRVVRERTFSGNTASDSGGVYNAGTATVQQSTLSGNTAGSDGGGIFSGASGTWPSRTAVCWATPPRAGPTSTAWAP